MKYADLSDANDFVRNMRRTPWLKLFPHWWSEKDLLLNAIGDEVERIKSQAIFTLLNSQIKPPVMIWQESLIHHEYHVTDNIKQLPSITQVQAPLYKTWGKIILNNHTSNDIDNLVIMITESDGLIIPQTIKQSDKIIIDLTNQKTTINDTEIQTQPIGEGIPYFKTVQNNNIYQNDTPLHNESIKVKIATEENIECDIDIDLQLDEVVFTNEQNIEVTGLELIPIEKIELFVKYDFQYNKAENGWHKVYEKKYNSQTNVLYDMITKQFYTKEFYVNVWYKTLQFPYQVGFPCYKDAEEKSMYHVNTNLDTWGEQLGLQRRLYKTNIDEKLYYKTYPPYYPADIEQDYWYYKRLINEYTWNDLSINDVDLKDIEGNNIVRLYSINPFVEDFVVHAKSTYTSDKEYVNFNKYIPKLVTQRSSDSNKRTQQTPFTNTRNVLKYDDRKTSVTLNSKSGLNINNLKYMSKELLTYFDLSDLPNDVNIDNIEVLVEADSTDNKIDKYSNVNTGIIIPNLYKNGDNIFIPLTADKNYQLSEQTITYSNKQISNYLKNTQIKATIGETYFNKKRTSLHMPITLLNNNKQINNIDSITIQSNDKNFKATYNQEENIATFLMSPNELTEKFQIICQYNDNNATINVQKDKDFIINEKGQYILQNISIENINNNKRIHQRATIGAFEDVEIGNKLQIPFTLIESQEEDIVVEDIYQVWIYFNDRLIEGKYNNNYIETSIPNQPITEMTIICKSHTHAPFTTKIDVITKDKIKKIKNKNDEEIEIKYKCISGPSVNQEASTIQVEDSWYTSDLRNRLQKEGLYFRNVLENSNEYSNSRIDIKNIILKVFYSPKKTDFNLYTSINKKSNGSKIGEYNIYIKNTGEKKLKTYIDVINAPNIKLSENIIDVELDIGEQMKKTIDIYDAQLPNNNGFYDIIAVCEDTICRDNIEVLSQGLIQTGIDIKYHHTKYNQDTTLSAKIKTSDLSIINSNVKNVSFYINGYIVGTTNIIDNEAKLVFNPSSKDFIKTGVLDLEVKFLGTNKYAASHKKNTIFISKDKTNINIKTNDIALYKQEYIIPVEVTDNNKEPITTGKVEYYLDDIFLGESVAGLDKLFTLQIPTLDLSPGEYTLYARYLGNDDYLALEESKKISIVGGNVNLYIDDIDALPIDEKNITIRVLDDEYRLIPSGFIDINIDDLDIHIENIEVQNGQADFILILNNATEGQHNVNVVYKNNQNSGYTEVSTQSILNVGKRKVNIERYAPYKGTQNEPLGFIFKVTDAITGELVNDGQIKVDVLSTNWDITPVNVKNGYARIIHNPVTMSAQEWESLSQYQFFIGKDYPSKIINNITGRQINIDDIDGFDLTYYNNIVDNIDKLFGIWSGEGDFPTQDNYFEIKNGHLYYHSLSVDNDDDITEFLIIDNEGHLHQQTSDTHRQYEIQNYNLKISFINSLLYKNKFVILENGLNIDNNYDINLDILKYNDLTYDSTSDTICYVTDSNNENINSGSVVFKLDNEIFYTSEVINGIAKIPSKKYVEITKGDYLLETLYKKNNMENIYSYSYYSMGKIKPLMNCNDFNKDKGQTSMIEVDLKIPNHMDDDILNGFVDIYMDNKKIDSLYLYGNEQYIGYINERVNVEMEKVITDNNIHFLVDIPDDIEQHNITITYNGNDLVELVSKSIDFIPAPAKVTLSCNPSKMAKNQFGNIEIFVNSQNYIINDGYVNILDSSSNVIAHSNVKNNKALLKWTPLENEYYTIIYKGSELYQCNEEYQIVSQEHYNRLSDNDKKISLIIDIIDAVDSINLTNEHEYGSLQTAIQCLSNDGNIIIEDDYIITDSIDINKNIHFYGTNDSALIKNSSDDIVIKIGNNASVTIENLILKSNNNNLYINNAGNLKITHSIINSDIKINSSNFLQINNSLVYSNISANNYNLDNNWWGSNTSPYRVNNNIILQITTDKYPPVISEDINIIGELIGANNKHYDIPNVDFILESETGFFGIDSGKMINGKIQTSYTDATEENLITLTVDRQSVNTKVYGYERKTEIIIDSIPEIPYKYYIPINAEVRSCADSYFNSDRVIDGYINFFLNNKQVGHVPIKENNIATLILYSKYDIGEYTLKAVYEPFDIYFKSEAEMSFNIIDDNNVVYVSPLAGNDYGTGKFDSPFKTIQKALNTESQTIYLKDEKYNESELNINKDVNIKSYCNEVSFDNINGEYIFSSQNYNLNLFNINFINNNVNNIFAHNSTVMSKYCIFQNNKQLFTQSDNIKILYSAIVSNKNIAEDITSFNFQYCWFGENNPRENINNNINNYIVMDIDSNKKNHENEIILYDGVVIRLTSTLKHYISHVNGQALKYDLYEKLPLRISNFISNDFSFQPIKDYTFNNQATSLLDTNKVSNNDNISMKISGTTQYINQKINITCQVTNQLNEQLNNEIVTFIIKQNDKPIINQNIKTDNGIATLTINPLKEGEYLLECSCNGYTKSETLIIKKEELWITSFNTSDSDNAHNLFINGTFDNTFSNLINDEKINIIIDDTLITNCNITNNNIQKTINYPMLKAGKHSLKIEYKGEKYDDYTYSTTFVSKEKETFIIFDYDFIQNNEKNDLDIYIRDDEKPVTKGNIDVYFDNNEYYSQDIKTIQCKDITSLNSYILLTTEDLINNKLYKNNNKIKVSILNDKNTEVYYREFNINNNKLISIDNDEYITYPIGNIDIENVSEQNSQSLIIVSFDIPYHDIMIKKEVNTHSLRVSIEGYDIEKSHIVKNAEINNGYYRLQLPILENNIQQHSILIVYNGYAGYYKECIKNKDNISTGIFGIQTDLPNIIYGDINKTLDIDTKITDMSNKPVFKGFTNIYIDDILVSENNNISNSRIITSFNLPNGIKPGMHNLRIEYFDNTNTYLDTIIQKDLQIRLLNTSINIKPYTAYPNEEVTIEYDIISDYGNVNTGFITFNINGEKISKEVSDGLFNQITFTAPNLPAGMYDMTVQYEDKNNIYNQSTLETQFTLNKNTVKIKPSHTWYYPKRPFIFTATFTNQDGLQANDGFASIYIDGVKEKDNIKIENGQASVYLEFDKVKKYEIIIIYEENIYHARTSYEYDFFINNIPINNITLDYDNHYINKVIFDTKDINVFDGILELQIDDNEKNKFFITEDNKDLDLDISYLTKGQHNINIKYYDSSIFESYINEQYTINIEPKSLSISIGDNDIYTNVDDYIDINTTLSEKVSGIIKYYIDDKYIGMTNIDNENKSIFNFKVPVSFNQKSYHIKAKFTGNEYYDESFSNDITLFIQKNQSYININDIMAQYKDTINLNINTNIDDNIYMKIYQKDDNNKQQLFDTVILDTKQENYDRYKLKDNLIAGEYILELYYPGSVYYDEYDETCKLVIYPFKPIINKDDIFISANVGGAIKLNSIVRDIDNIPILHNGYIKYNIDNIEYENIVNLNTITDIKIDEEIENIKCYYFSDDDKKYLNTEEDIPIIYSKNDIEIIIDNDNDISRGSQYEWNIYANSSTTLIKPDNITYNVKIQKEHEDIYIGEGLIINGESKLNIAIPLDLPYENKYKIILTTEENDIFRPSIKEIIVNNLKQDIINVNPEIENETKDTVKTLSRAYDLIKDNGLINILGDIQDEEIINDKTLNIKGNNNTLQNCFIINESELNIDNITFYNTLSAEECKNFIKNNNILNVQSCTFKNNKQSAIYNNKRLTIYKSNFYNNNAQSGSCIYINNKNYRTVINECNFNENNSQNYGSCIYSDKGNDLDILYSSFTNNKSSLITGECIYVRGNIYISSVYFYNNKGECEIRLNDGVLEIDKSLFDKTKPINIINGDLIANMNYWGTNNVEEDIIMNPTNHLNINSWVNMSYVLEENESEYRITVLVDKYINTSEEEIKTINNLNDNFPIKINDIETTLNNPIVIKKPIDDIIIQIGLTNEKVI